MQLETTNMSYERRILEVKSKKSQVPATHQLILENLLQVPAQVTFVQEYGFENCLWGHPYKSRGYCDMMRSMSYHTIF